MARLTRRAGLALAGATVVVAVATRKFLAGPGFGPGPGPGPGFGTAVAPAGPPAVDMRPLSDMVASEPPRVLPPLHLRTLDGAAVTLADYAGRPVVLNFWATWCVPCVAELPELDRLAASGAVTVLAVSADRGGAAVVRRFLAAHDVRHATVLLDAGSEAVHALQVAGFPTTLLIGRDGRLRGTLEGPAAWGSAEEKVKELLF